MEFLFSEQEIKKLKEEAYNLGFCCDKSIPLVSSIIFAVKQFIDINEDALCYLLFKSWKEMNTDLNLTYFDVASMKDSYRIKFVNQIFDNLSKYFIKIVAKEVDPRFIEIAKEEVFEFYKYYFCHITSHN